MRNKDYRPTLPQLCASVATADTGHFGQAAVRFGISQPSLSQVLSTLEQGLGVQLIERSTRRMLVMPLDRGLIPYIHQAPEIADETVARASGRTDDLSGPLSIGVVPTVVSYVLLNLLRLVRDELPDLKPRIVEEPTQRLIESLRPGTIDAVITTLPSDVSSSEEVYLYDEELHIVVPEDHLLADKKGVKLEAIGDLDLLLLDDSHCLRDQVLDICHKVDAVHGEASSLETRAVSPSTVVQCVAGGLGQPLVSESAIKIEADRSSLAVACFEGPARPGHIIGLVHRASSIRGNEFNRIAELVWQVYIGAVA